MPCFAWLCTDGMAASPFTSLILLPLPTEQVWSLLRKCGHCPERRAAEPGAPREVSRCPTHCCYAAHVYYESTWSALAPYPQTEPPIFKDDNPLGLSEGFAPSCHVLTVTLRQDFLALSCVYCAQDMFPTTLRIIPLGNIQLLWKPMTLKPPFLSIFLQEHNKAGHH